MVSKTVDQLPVAPPEAVAVGSIMILHENGLEYRATAANLGGVHIFFTSEEDQTPFVYGRLVSPGKTVENITISLIATPVGGGTVVTRSAITDALGNFTYDFTPYLARGVTYNIEAKISTYLTTTTVKTIAALAVPTSSVVATSTGKVGDNVVLTVPSFSGSPTTLRYRVLRGASYIIAGATSTTYTLQPDDDGDMITIQVQATNAGGDSPWYPANSIGPVTNKTSVLVAAPVISGPTTLGGRIAVSSPGSASENAVVKSDEWQIDQAKIPAHKSAVIKYLAGAANSTVPTAYPDGNNHHGVGLGGSAYTGSNTYNYSVAASTTDNDYLSIPIGEAGGNEGAQNYDVHIKHLNTNSSIRIKMYAAKYRGGIQIAEAQMSKVGATAGTELNGLAVATNAVSSWTLSYDFGEWLAGDWLVFRQSAQNISSSSSNNYQWDARAGVSTFSLPIGAVQDLQKTLASFTTRNDMAGKKVRLARTFTNRNNDVIGYSNEITLEAVATQTVAPANTTLPAIVAKSDRSNNVWQADFGAWSNQPSEYAIQWIDNGVDIAGATTMSYTVPSSLEGHDLTFRVTATNDIGSTSATSLPKTVLAAATFYNTELGNDTNDGKTEENAKQTLNGSDTTPSGSTAIMKGDFGTRLKIGSNRNYEGSSIAECSIGSTDVAYAIDHYTDDGSLGRSNVKISKLRITSGDRAIVARQGANWVIEDVILENVGFNPIVSAENASGMMFYKNNGLTLRRVQFLLVNSDGFYSDTNDKVIVEDCTFLPVMTAEGDTIQTRADRTASDGSPGPHQKGYVQRGTFLDMHSRKTSSGKGCLVTNMADYVYVHDNVMDGNNFVHGTDEGDNQVFCRNVSRYARKNSYSFGYAIGGYDNQPASHNHQCYDNSWYDMNRAYSFTGISVTGYAGVKSGRVDIVAHDETVVKCANGIRIDRPTSGKFRGFVFHNVTKPVDRALTTLPPGGDIQAFISTDHFTYNGSILVPPTVTTRAVITGTRTVGSVLTGGNTVFDTSAVLAAFPGAVVTRSYQWRRHKPAVQWSNWSEHMGYTCEWIDGATSSSYTITDDDQGCLVSRVDRIHLSFTETSVAKVVTAIAYDATYATSTPIPRSGDLAIPLPAIPTTATISASASAGTVALDLPDLLTGETRTLLHTARAYDPYTGTSVAIDVNGDVARGVGALTAGTTFSTKIRQKRGIDIVDSNTTFTVVA